MAHNGYNEWHKNSGGDEEVPINPNNITQESIEDKSEMVQWVSNWYKSITSRESRIKMVKNYIDGITNDNVTEEQCEEAALYVIERFEESYE